MNTKKQDKLKHLFEIWPVHTIATANWLLRHGFKYENLAGYLHSGWISRVGAGAFKRQKDQLTWEGAIYGVQQQYPHRIHLGGRTALELSGASHFIPLGQPKLFLFSSEKKKFPLWISKFFKSIKIPYAYLQYNFLPSELGLTQYNCGEFHLIISSRERAALELVELLARFHDFEECRLLFENLGTLRANLVQELLESCTSIKAKRVFLFLSKHLGHQWVKDLNISRIDLGSGPRYICTDGIYDPEFKITIPKGFFNDDKLGV